MRKKSAFYDQIIKRLFFLCVGLYLANDKELDVYPGRHEKLCKCFGKEMTNF